MLNRIAQSLLIVPGLCLRFLFSFGCVQTKDCAPIISLAKAKELLVIRLDVIGDFALTSAFLRELRRSAPAARITLAVNRIVEPLAKSCPYVDEVIAFDPKPYSGSTRDIFERALLGLWIRLRYFLGHRFDLVLLPRRGNDYNGAEFMAHLWAASAPIAACRDQFDLPRTRQRFTLNTVHYFSNPHKEHEVQHTLRFLRWCGGESSSEELEVWPTAQDKAFARELLGNRLARKDPLIVIHPSGGRFPLKQWPTEKFQALLSELQRTVRCEFLIVGGADEIWIQNIFPSTSNHSLNLAGQLELGQLTAILAEADLFIGCDSGPMHLAVAAGIPVLAIFGSTSQIRFRPYSLQSEVVSLEMECSPDRKGNFTDRCSVCIYDQARCLTELSVELVLEHVLRRLAEVEDKANKVARFPLHNFKE